MTYKLHLSDSKHPDRKRVEELLAGNVPVGVEDAAFIFRKPNTSDCLIRYRLIDPTPTGGWRSLVVTGDLGAAVYEFGGDLSFQWLAGLGFEYFASKCTASEHGRGYTCWNPRAAHDRLDALCQLFEDDNPRRKELAEFLAAEVTPGSDILYTRECWANFVDRELIGRFFEDHEGLLGIGETINLRCIAHLRGIQKTFLKDY